MSPSVAPVSGPSLTCEEPPTHSANSWSPRSRWSTRSPPPRPRDGQSQRCRRCDRSWPRSRVVRARFGRRRNRSRPRRRSFPLVQSRNPSGCCAASSSGRASSWRDHVWPPSRARPWRRPGLRRSAQCRPGDDRRSRTRSGADGVEAAEITSRTDEPTPVPRLIPCMPCSDPSSASSAATWPSARSTTWM